MADTFNRALVALAIEQVRRFAVEEAMEPEQWFLREARRARTLARRRGVKLDRSLYEDYRVGPEAAAGKLKPLGEVTSRTGIHVQFVQPTADAGISKIDKNRNGGS